MSYESEEWTLEQVRDFMQKAMLVPEFAKWLGRPKRTVYRWIEEGWLGFAKIGGRIYVPMDQKITVEHYSQTSGPLKRRGGWFQ